MKNIFTLLVAVNLLSLVACKKISCQTVTVVKDCTGAYLRLNNKDYHVCNTEKLGGFNDKTVVTASFKKINVCTGTAKDAIVCMMVHQNEGWIEVESIAVK